MWTKSGMYNVHDLARKDYILYHILYIQFMLKYAFNISPRLEIAERKAYTCFFVPLVFAFLSKPLDNTIITVFY